MKKVIFTVVILLSLFIFTACENGVSFEAIGGLIEDSLSENGDDVITDPDNTGDEDEDESNDENLDETEHTGSNVFSYSLISNNAPENMMYSEPEGMYVRLEDTTGYGYTASFNLNLVLPENSGEAEGVTVQIHDYSMKEGDDNSLNASFASGLKKHTFTASNNFAEITFQSAEKRMLQEGHIKITFSYDPTIYNDSVPTTVLVLYRSIGNNEKKHIAIKSVRETTDQAYAKIYEGSEAMTWNIAINDSESDKPSQWFDLPLSIDLYNVESGAPLTLSASSNTGLDLRSYTISNPSADGQASINLVLRANKIGIAEPVQSSAILTIDSEYTDIYAALPLSIYLNTERKEFFEYYASDYVNKFTVTSSGSAKDENGKYYTAIRLPGASEFEIEKNKTLNYIIRRIDDTSGEKKEIRTGTFVSNEGFTYWDRDALILTKKPMYELEISTANVSVISSSMKEGTRNLTNYELALAAMNSFRYAVVEGGGQGIAGNVAADANEWLFNSTYRHYRDYWNSVGPYFKHYYSFNRFRPYFMELNGADKYTVGKNNLENVAFTYVSYKSWGIIGSENADSIKSNIDPFRGTLEFSSDYGSGYILLNDVNIGDNEKNSPAWSSGTIQVSGDGKVINYDNNDGLPFGFYMSYSAFLEKIALGGAYTQK